MTISGTYFMNQLNSARPFLKDLMPDWDVVTLPVDPQNPEGAGGMNVNSILAVDAQSPNRRDAWEFVNFVNSDEYARVASKAHMESSTLPARTRYLDLASADGRNIRAFAELEGASSQANANVPVDFTQAFIRLADTAFKAVLEGTQTLDEALQTIEEQGEAELFKAKQTEAR